MPGGTPHALQAADVEAIERATFDAVPPEALVEVGGWLLGLDHGTVGRAHSAVPLSHAGWPEGHAIRGAARRADFLCSDPSILDGIEARYASAGLRAVLRVPDIPAFEGTRTGLLHRGYRRAKPTCVFTGTLAPMAAMAGAGNVDLLVQPDDAWRAVFLGEGFDPADGANRVGILSRAKHAVYARVLAGGQTVAAGMGSYSHGWASVHGMRTLASFRGRGLASAILAALAREGQARGIENVFLQVDASNTGAQALYQRAGFSLAWGYEYWAAPPGVLS